MAFLKSSSSGKKQTPMPGPNSAAYKKIVAARKNAKAAEQAKPAPKMNDKKRPRSAAAFSSLKSRQKLVERIKREIWASVMRINHAIIKLAAAGNLQAAKALFDFAGVYSLPPIDDENAEAALEGNADSASGEARLDPVEGFFRSIGVPACPEPEPSLVG